MAHRIQDNSKRTRNTSTGIKFTVKEKELFDKTCKSLGMSKVDTIMYLIKRYNSEIEE